MEQYVIEKDYKHYEGPILDEITKNVMDSLTPDLLACMAARIPFDIQLIGNKLTIKTRWKVSILKEEKTGRIINIYYKKE